MIKFQKIGSFADVFKYVKRLKDKGQVQELLVNLTPKIHGTNASVVLHKNGEITVQSRERELSLESDNYGFCAWVNLSSVKSFISSKLEDIIEKHDLKDKFQAIVVYGEWAGQGVQKNVATSEVPKFFAPFSVKIVLEDEEIQTQDWKDFRNEELRILPVFEFTKTLDVKNPQSFVDELNEFVQQFENECPYALKEFGVSGVGEGLVGSFEVAGILHRFKAKGEKHSVRKEKQPVYINPEHLKGIDDFIEYALTENRVEQGIQKVQELGHPFDKKSTPIFMKWIVQDVLEEEQSQIQELVNQGIDFVLIKNRIGKCAVKLWMNKLETI